MNFDVCPRCGFGEKVECPESEYWTEGIFYVCDCGYSTMKSKVDYKEWKSKAEYFVKSISKVIHEQKEPRVEIARLSNFISDRFVAHVNAYGAMGDGKDMKRIAPKSRIKREALERELKQLEETEDRLFIELNQWRNLWPAYANLWDKERNHEN